MITPDDDLDRAGSTFANRYMEHRRIAALNDDTYAWHEPDDFVTVYETRIKLTRFGDPVFVRWSK